MSSISFNNIFMALSNGIVYSFLSKVMGFLNKHIKVSDNFSVVIGNNRMFTGSCDRTIAAYLWKHGLLESRETNLVRDIVKEGMAVLDIGANIGYYTLICAELVGPRGKVYAFEPDPVNYGILARNIVANSYKNVVAISKAATERNCTLKLYKNKGNRGDNSVMYKPNGSKSEEVVIEGVRLDDFIDQKVPIDFVKMDIQGAEINAFWGMQRIVRENKNIKIIMEFNVDQYLKDGIDVKEFYNKLITDYGFTVFLIEEHKKEITPVDENYIDDLCRNRKSVNLYLRRA